MAFSRVLCVPLSAIVGAGVATFALTGEANATCTITASTGVIVDCQDEIVASLTYNPSTDELTLSEDGVDSVIITDLTTDDQIIINANETGAIDELDVFTETATLPSSPTLNLGEGDDSVSIFQGTLNGTINGGPGDDVYLVDDLDSNPTTVDGIAFSGGSGDDTVTVVSTGPFTLGAFAGGVGDDTFTITEGTVASNDSALSVIGAGPGDDIITVGTGASVLGRIAGDAGNDTIDVSGTVNESGSDVNNQAIGGAAGDDIITLRTGANVTGQVGGFSGEDIITVEVGAFITDPSAFPAINGGTEDDIITVGGVVDPLGGPVAISGGESTMAGVSGDDIVTILPGAVVGGDVLTFEGEDTITSSGLVTGDVGAGAGDDTVAILGGSVGNVTGGAGLDSLTLGGGILSGSISDFETITFDGSLGGDAFSGSLDIDGNNTELTINNTNTGDFDASFDDIEIDGVTTANINNSVLLGLNGPYGIDTLSLNGSTIGFSGTSSINPVTAGQSTLNLNNSTLSLFNGEVGDTVTVDNLNLTNSTIALDIDPTATDDSGSPGLDSDSDSLVVAADVPGAGDSVIVTNETTTTGDNVVAVNFTQAPAPGVTQVLPIATFSGAGAPTGSELADGFTTIQIGDNVSPLVALSVLQGADGLFLEVTPAEDIAPPPAVVNAATLNLTTESVGEVNTEITDAATGFATGATRIQITPTFGVFATGQFGRSFHDGFDVSGPVPTMTTPEFEADLFSAIAVAELDASAEFNLVDDDIGLRLSAFGGYVESDVDFSVFRSDGSVSPFRGGGTNQGVVVGGTVLASKIQGQGNLNYGLLSSALFVGDVDTTNPDTGGKGNYDTTGLVLSAKVGRNIAVADRVRLDVRFGASYNTFHGTSFVDSSGVAFGDSRTSYGTVSFEPGVSTAFVLGNAIVQPQARLLLSQRLGYDNEASVNGLEFDFDDGDTMVGGQLGASVKFNESLSGGAFVEGRLTEDSESIFGKLAIKYTIPRS